MDQLNAEDVIERANKITIKQSQFRVLQQLYEETFKDMDEAKPVRRLLVIPEIKDESESDDQ